MSITGGYTINHGDRYAGMVVDSQANNSISKLNKSGDVVPWGIFVVRYGDDGFDLADESTTAADIIGVVRRELNRAQADGQDVGAPDKRDATILTMGTIYVPSLGAVNAGEDVYVVVGDAGHPAVDPGIVNNAVGSDPTKGVKIEGAKFLETTSDAGIVAISLVIGG